MFQITECDPVNGFVVVEDLEFGLKYEFKEPTLAEAKVVDDYDLHITTRDGQTIVLPILER
ncbi:MAG: hypothetical protein B7Y05_18515 [Polynucleobacter sp. 24-46-87]|jgi:hypothetical protein|nr:MAG: hypothetical protein B7Y22_00835 [Polynucleobacter sp. 16-46-70]OZA08824.1 MAG: hypothetical protein B7Y05_18515 [Polynucleobacter sp. 24-46-87]OZA41633.1 MAG: hypothetical protein B7X83_01785 [Polynucleobacter sp. 17-46-58]HQR83508.1 hypothetical protein [Polynucleobacter sp.]HQT19722.1 hypothetical protein [Polynucleobacter sp.]